MIRKKILFIPFLATMLLSLPGCLEDNGNYATVPDLAVIGYNLQMGGTTLRVSNGEVAAPSLTGFYEGDCVHVVFKIDYDNQQPNANYYTATEIEVLPIGQRPLRIISAESEDNFTGYDLPFSGLGCYPLSPFYNGKVFFGISYKADPGTSTDPKESDKNKKITYELFCNPDIKDENGVISVFLRAKLAEGGNYNSNNSIFDVYAFDLQQLIYRYGEAVTRDNVNLQSLKVYFRYFKSLDNNGNPVYSDKDENGATLTPYELLLFR